MKKTFEFIKENPIELIYLVGALLLIAGAALSILSKML